MTFDSWLVARLARELEALLRGARVQAIHSSEARLTLYCYRRGAESALHAVLDQNSPLVAAVPHERNQKEKGSRGWADSVGTLLRGCTVDAIQAVPNDRVVFVDLSSRSAFGLPSRTRIVFELQPRKANVLILRAGNDDIWINVAAAKQFEAPAPRLKQRLTLPARSVKVGAPYILPPARKARLDRAQFIVMCDTIEKDDRDSFVRLLGDVDPACTPPLGREVVHRVLGGTRAHSVARQLLTTWQTIHAEVAAAEDRDDPVYVYRHNNTVVAAHLIPLSWPEAAATKASSLNDLCRGDLEKGAQTQGEPDLEAVRKKLTTMLSRCKAEVATLHSSQRKAQQADELRRAGETIYSNLTSISKGAKAFTGDGSSVALDPLLTAKENAAQYFKRYKKARSGLPQIEARLKALTANRDYWEQLVWELERVVNSPPAQRQAIVAELKTAAGIKARKSPKTVRLKREDQKVELSGGAVAYVGRSPKDNERLTFSIANPNDFWFHARGIPGAHVIVKANGARLTQTQIKQAAGLAAGHSRGASSTAVDVDYTQRKHVRRQSAGRPGLVWYDDFQTIRVQPKVL